MNEQIVLVLVLFILVHILDQNIGWEIMYLPNRWNHVAFVTIIVVINFLESFNFNEHEERVVQLMDLV
jgi:hypothetical protein